MTPDEYAEDITRLDHADHMGWIENEDLDPWGETRTVCSCPYCWCGNTTEYGEVCNDCLLGIHQG